MENKFYENEEINLFSVLKDIYVESFKIIIIAVVLSVIGIILINNNYDRNYTISFEIEKISPLEEKKYDPINKSSLFKLNESNIDNLPFINSIMLIEESIRQIKSNFIDIYKKSLEDKKLSEKERIQTASVAQRTLQIQPSKDKDYYTINFQTKYLAVSRSFVESLYERINLKVDNKMQDFLIDLQENIKFERNIRVTAIRNEISTALFKKRLSLEQKKQFLNEQASIAREVGIEVSDFMEIFSNDNSSNVVISDENLGAPLYLRGYRALEKEIKLIDSKLDSSTELFSSEVSSLKAQIKLITDSKDLESLKIAIEKTPIGKKEFFSASLKSYNGVISSSPDKFLINSLIVLISLLLSIIIILFLKSFKIFLRETN